MVQSEYRLIIFVMVFSTIMFFIFGFLGIAEQEDFIAARESQGLPTEEISIPLLGDIEVVQGFGFYLSNPARDATAKLIIRLLFILPIVGVLGLTIANFIRGRG